MKRYGIRFSRKRTGLNQREVAKELGISLTTYNRKEKGEAEFKVCELVRLAEMFDWTTEDVNEILFGGKLKRTAVRND